MADVHVRSRRRIHRGMRACVTGRFVLSVPGLFASVAIAARPVAAQRVIELTLERAVEMAMDDSYQVRRVRLDVSRRQLLLEAQRAALKSRVTLNFSLPQFEQISEQRWNSVLQRNEIVGENTRRWEMSLSIEQPVILFGFPTNGYLSLNNRMYRYTQYDEGERDLTYYNRYFIRYRQPLFQTNTLRNELERAELDLQQSELQYQQSAINILQDVSRDYHELFETAYEEGILSTFVSNLEAALEAANERAAQDSARLIDVQQTQVALSNARSDLDRVRSDFRLEASEMKPDLGLQPRDSIIVRPVIEVRPLRVDLERAIELGLTLQPRMRTLEIEMRNARIEFDNVRQRNSFRLDVEVTYGREMQNDEFGQLMSDPKNSYTVGITGSLPIWDWGERRARIEAQRLTLQRQELSIQETREQIEVSITNTVRNLEEYQRRAQDMETNLALATQVSAQSLEQYRVGTITILDLLQAFERQKTTAGNFLDAYMGYRGAILQLQQSTYYDFENDMPVLALFGVGATDGL